MIKLPALRQKLLDLYDDGDIQYLINYVEFEEGQDLDPFLISFLQKRDPGFSEDGYSEEALEDLLADVQREVLERLASEERIRTFISENLTELLETLPKRRKRTFTGNDEE